MKTYAYAVIAIVFALLVLGGGFAYWWHGHEQFKAGQASKQAQYDSLISQYTEASKQSWAQTHAKDVVRQQAIDAAAAHEKEGLANANANFDRLFGNQRAVTERLRKEWRVCQATAASAPGADSAGVGAGQDRLRLEGVRSLLRYLYLLQSQRNVLQTAHAATVRAEQ